MLSNSPKTTEITVLPEEALVRLDVFLSTKISDYSRSYLQKLIKSGNVYLNDTVNKVSKTTVTPGDKIKVDWPPEQRFELPKGEPFVYPILFEDDDLIVINKPPGAVVHPATGNWEGTIVNALVGRSEGILDEFADEADILSAQRPGIVHRLDKDTSGCLVIAKNILSKQHLCESFASRNVKKTYSALTYGVPNKFSGEIKTLIGRHSVNRKKNGCCGKKWQRSNNQI